jgi:DNA-binding Lrp family transcriptional regulator
MRAYILLSLEPGKEREFMRDLEDLQPILEANLIHGPYDCIVELRANHFEGINDIVYRIREMDGVTDTLTCLVTHSWMRPE